MSDIDFYNRNAESLDRQYSSTNTAEVHACWLELLKDRTDLQILDIGAGNGRDACYFAGLGHYVVTVEPADELRQIGQANTRNLPVYWLKDSLPELKHVFNLQTRFHLIVLSAVWMHIPASQRERAFRKLTNLLKPGGQLVITLRHGPSLDERKMYPVSQDEIYRYCRQYGLGIEKSCSDKDSLKRGDVSWETLVLKLPDDGSGAFPTIRNILMNDNKAATYKLALIRTLLRIADGHPGAVIRREDDHVILPLGLVSLYWARQYLPLLQQNIQQNNNPNKGLGFVTEDGWRKIEHFSPLDFSIGNLFSGDDATALHKTLKTIGSLIKRMPANYITLPGSDRQVFEVDIFKTGNKTNTLFTDLTTLKQYGEFSIPVKIWDLMTQYACWIEPVCLSEWVNVMKDFQNNRSVLPQTLNNLLNWSDPARSTQEVRRRVEMLKKPGNVDCVWSRKGLGDHYEIDHCLPFARWPNNDLWNLMPARRQVNNQKRDRIATTKRYNESRETILDWWQTAWSQTPHERSRFYTEASFSLPGIEANCSNKEDVFEALKLQSQRVAELQALRFW